MKKEIESLKKQMQMLNGGESHMQMGMEDNTIAVLSVYEGQRAAHDILNDLVDWAEDNDNQVLLAKIDELATLK